MKLFKISLLVLIISLIPKNYVFAEEEASGWAIVDESGAVHGVIACTESVCGQDGLWEGVMPQDTQWPGMLLVKQTMASEDGNVVGYWGTYDNNKKEFNVDRGCFDCDPWENLETPGIIRDGILTPPIFKAYEELVLEEELNVSKASSLIAYTMAYRQATSFKNNIKLSKNLRKFKKTSTTENVCVVRKNRVLIKNGGSCKILVEGKKNKKVVKMKVYK
jgi:hypothetical protein